MVVRLGALVLVLTLSISAFAAGPLLGRQRVYIAAEIENGARVYQANCSGCHGPDGDAVAGTNFSAGRLRRASSDDDLVRIIVRGIPGTPMPPSNFSEGQAGTIVAYLRSMAATTTATAAAAGASGAPGANAAGAGARGVTAEGDAGRGRSLFEGRGQCLTCHSVNGNGSRVGPALTDVGAVRRSSDVERSLLEPDAEIRAENRSVRAVTRDGATITGRLLNQDSFTLQLLDSNERLVSIAKSNLRDYAVLKISPMPSYRNTLNPQELADVVSYLASLKGRQ